MAVLIYYSPLACVCVCRCRRTISFARFVSAHSHRREQEGQRTSHTRHSQCHCITLNFAVLRRCLPFISQTSQTLNLLSKQNSVQCLQCPLLCGAMQSHQIIHISIFSARPILYSEALCNCYIYQFDEFLIIFQFKLIRNQKNRMKLKDKQNIYIQFFLYV